MTLVKVWCESCGKYLGSYVASGGSFGISDMQQGEEKQMDPDCRDCNPNYDKKCPVCYWGDIDKNGKCKNKNCKSHKQVDKK